MRIRWIVAAAVALLVGVAIWTWIDPRADPRASMERPATAEAPEAAELASPTELEPTSPSAPRVAAEPSPPPPSARVDANACEIRGRFVLPGGVPAAGMPVEVEGWTSSEEAVHKHGLPERWKDPRAETDAAGRFSIRFDPPQAYQFVLEAKTPGHAGAEWRWGQLLAGAVVDLGEVELVRGGTIEGRIVDADGNVVPGEWYVYARSIGLREFDGRDETQVTTWADPITGRFRAEDVMPGRVELSADGSVRTEDTLAQVRPGETVQADIVVASREASRRVTLVASSKWLRTLLPEPERVTLTGADGRPRTPKARRFGFHWLFFEDLEPGEYTLAIDDPRFRPWSCKVRPGVEVEAELEGTSGLQLTVRDLGGAAVEFFALDVELRNVDFSPHEFEVPEWDMSLSQGLLAGLTPGDYRITARAGEHVGAVDVDGLRPGETRAIEVLVGTECEVSGSVRYADGQPAAEAAVVLFPGTSADPEIAELFAVSGEKWITLFGEDLESTVAGAGGSFRFAVLRAGEHVVCAVAPNGSLAVSEPLDLHPGDAHTGLELVLPLGGFVAGRILAPPGASCAGLRMGVGSGDQDARARAGTSRNACELGDDGRFEIGPIRPGPASVYLMLPVQERRLDGASRMGVGHLGNLLELGTVEVVEAERIERDFEVGAFPGRIVLELVVNGEEVAGLEVELSSVEPDDGSIVAGGTDARGRFGPAFAFPGSWTVTVSDPELRWRYTHPASVRVTAAGESRARVHIDVVTASLLFLDAATGAPLAQRDIHLLHPEDDGTWRFPSLRRKTDADGRAEWTLATGEHRFRLGPESDMLFELPDMSALPDGSHTASVVWTATGPLTREVRL